jgi:hypothetical protein
LATLSAGTTPGDQPMKIQHLSYMWHQWETIVVPQYKIYPKRDMIKFKYENIKFQKKEWDAEHA